MLRWINIALFCCGVLCGAEHVCAAGEDGRLEVGNEHVRIILERRGERWVESYLAFGSGGWKPMLESGHRLRPDPSWRRDGTGYDRGYSEAEVVPTPPRIQEVKLTAQDGKTSITKRIIVREGDPFVHVTLTAMIERRTSVTYLLAPYTAFPGDSVAFQGRRPDFIFTPQLRPDSQDVIGDHVFRSPALMMQRDSRFVALIPDPALMNTPRRVMRTGADVQMDGGATPLMAYGLLPWTKRAHVYYHHHDALSVAVEDTALSCGYYLYLRANAPEREGYRDVVRFLWDRFGHVNFSSARGPQGEPFSAYMRKAWDEYVPLVALDTVYRGAPVTLLRQARLAWSNAMPKAADNDCWFNVWFNALRTAYGMALHARMTGNAELLRRAQGVLNLALLAPQERGIAPAIFYIDSAGGHWVADHAWGGIEKGRFLPMFHNAWTGIWLLQWADLYPDRRSEVLRFTGQFARFLAKNQAASGVIPSWYEPGTLTPAPEFRDENAETAGAAYFLAEYARQTGDSTSLRSAVRAMEYVFREIEPEHRWFDYETFFSCSRKPLGFFDSFTGQHPQNTLSMHQAAEACLSLFEITGENRYLQRGAAILDYLSLYQQVWSPRWLSCELFGGFGVQNTDGEWSDSRQGYFAVTYMRYYAATGRHEYFERGVAALRAMFSLFESPESPRTAENYAHSASDKLAGVTGLHWGTGSSVVSIHLIAAQYGDAFVDVSGQWGAGIDGCRITGVQSTPETIRLTLTDVVSTPRTIRLVFGNVRSERMMVTVNGRTLGQFTADALQRGIHVDL